MSKSLLLSLIASLLLFSCTNSSVDSDNCYSESIDSSDSSESSKNEESSELSEHEHTFNNDVWEYDAQYHWHPSTCGHDVTSTPIKHIYEKDVVAPTYETSGYTNYTCVVCGYFSYKGDYVDELKHSFSSNWSYDSQTHWHACLDKGYENLKSDESCHHLVSKTIPATGQHGGYVSHDCTVCPYSYIDNETDPLTYTITWKNYDGQVLKIDTGIPYGATPSYEGKTPLREKDVQYSYVFSGWSPSLHRVTANAVYKAKFEAVINIYTITWKNYDGEVLKVDNVPYGETPLYDGEIPAKPNDGLHYYTQNGWSPAISSVVGDVTYTAQFKENELFNLELSSSGNEYTIAGINQKVENVEIPAFINDIPVKYIADNAFANHESINKVIIPENIVSIGKRAFKNCVNLSQISLPTTLLTIGEYAFAECSSLKTIAIPDGVASIGRGIFRDCSKIDSVSLPFIGQSKSNLSTIEYFFSSSTFFDGSDIPTSLQKVTLSYSCEELQKNAFNNCANLKTIEINGNDTVISEQAFNNCPTLNMIVLGPSITKITDSAFSHLTALSSLIMSDSITSIGESALSGCISLESIVIPDSVTWIGNFAFSSCHSLKSIVIPDSVTYIGNYAFSRCSSLESVTIGDGVTTIWDRAFSDCTSLKSVTIGDDVTSIKDYAFSGCASLQSIEIPDSVTAIGSHAFENCSSLESVTIGDGVTSIDGYSFFGCSSLKSVSIGSGITRLLQFATLLGSLQRIDVSPENNKYSSIDGVLYSKDGRALIRCPEGRKGSLVIPDGVTSIDECAFSGCASLKSVTIGDGVTSIGIDTFSGCTSLSYMIEGGLKYLGNEANPYVAVIGPEDTSIKSATINDSCRVIAGGAFFDCSSLKSIVIPNDVTSIGDKTFSNCSSLESIVIPDSVTSFGSDALLGCSSLQTVYCVAKKRPTGWSEEWDRGRSGTLVWGYEGE